MDRGGARLQTPFEMTTDDGRVPVGPGPFDADAEGFVFHRQDIDRGEVTGAPQAGQLDRVTTVGVHAVARLCGNQRGRYTPMYGTPLHHSFPVRAR